MFINVSSHVAKSLIKIYLGKGHDFLACGLYNVIYCTISMLGVTLLWCKIFIVILCYIWYMYLRFLSQYFIICMHNFFLHHSWKKIKKPFWYNVVYILYKIYGVVESENFYGLFSVNFDVFLLSVVLYVCMKSTCKGRQPCQLIDKVDNQCHGVLRIWRMISSMGSIEELIFGVYT